MAPANPADAQWRGDEPAGIIAIKAGLLTGNDAFTTRNALRLPRTRAPTIRSCNQTTVSEVTVYEALQHANEVGKKMSKRAILGIIGALVVLIAWWSCHHRASSDQPGSNATAGASGKRGGLGAGGGHVPVVAGTVERKDMPIYLVGLGTVQAFNTVTVHTRVDGELQKVLFTEGQDVKTGDLLAVIDPRPFQAALDQAIAKKAQDEAQLANAKVTLARNTNLLNKKVIDQQDFDTSKYQGDQFQAAVQADQAAIEAARTQLDYTQIKSPIDGRTGVRLVDLGNIVHAADQTGIVVITQLKPISVVFTLPEQNLPAIFNQGGANGGLHVSALDRGNTMALDEGSLAVVDNGIAPIGPRQIANPSAA